MQTQLQLFAASGDDTSVISTPRADVKNMLENYIQVCGLIAFKDFFMKVKSGQIENIPECVTRTEYLSICRDVFQSRAGRLDRQAGRKKFFAIKNKNKK